MSSKSNVSKDFMKFYGQHSTAIEEQKKAENNMSTSPTPIGWSGQCTLLEARADKGKDKKNADGTVKPGSPYVLLKFGIVGDEKYQGKTFNLLNAFYETKNATATDRFGWFLNLCENLGLPREIRENHEDLSEILDWLLDSEKVYEVECQADEYNRQDGKKMVVRQSTEPVDNTSSMAPTPESSTDTNTLKEGSTVNFLGGEWVIQAMDGEHLQIAKPDGSRSRSITKAMLS